MAWRRQGHDRSSTAVRPRREEPRRQVEGGDQQPERRVRIVRVIQARRVARAPGGVDPERADLPIAGDGAHHEENDDQAGEEEEESKLSPAATVRFVRRGWPGADWRSGEDGDRRAVGYEGDHGFHRGADWRDYDDGFRRHGWSGGERGFNEGLRVGRHGRDRHTRLGGGPSPPQFLQLCPGRAGRRRPDRRSRDVIGNGRRRQLGKPLLQLCLVRWILWLGSTPRWEAHLRPTLAPSDYGSCFVRGRSAMSL